MKVRRGHIDLSVFQWNDLSVSIEITEIDAMFPSGSRTAKMEMALYEFEELLRSQGYELRKINYAKDGIQPA